MKTIDFTQLGGFPLKQLTTKTMQDTYNSEILQAFIEYVTQGVVAGNLYAQADFWSAVSGFILTGVELDNSPPGSITPGWIIRNGELLYFAGAPLEDVLNGNGIGIQTTTTNATFKNGQIHPVYVEKIAVAGGNDPKMLNEYNRIPNLSQFARVIRYNTIASINVPTIDLASSAYLDFNVTGAEIGDAVVVGANIITDLISVRGYVVSAGVVRVKIINEHSASFPGGNTLFKIRVIK